MAIVKKNNFVLFVFISYIIILLGRIPVYHMIGKDGMAYFSLALESSYPLPRAQRAV